jgi:type VI secretion system secreted protein VgrG
MPTAHALIPLSSSLSIQEATDVRGQAVFACSVSVIAAPAHLFFSPFYLPALAFVPSLQSATVVGPDNQDVYTDSFGRVRVKFHWDHLPHHTIPSCWVRVAQHAAGAHLGFSATPRIGQEVLIDFEHNSPDKPIIIASLTNPNNLPPWQLPRHAFLSGFRSRELSHLAANAANGRSNHLLFDDSFQKIQAQLHSDHASSSLSLGYVRRVPNFSGIADYRGQGFELRSDAPIAIRSAKGLLISSFAQPKISSHALDITETSALLRSSVSLHQSLASAADEVMSSPDHAIVPDSLAGHLTPLAAKSAPHDSGSMGEFDDPHVLVSSAASLAVHSDRSVSLASSDHLAFSADQHISLSSSANWIVSARDAIKGFAHRAGVRLFAYAGDIDIKALQTSIQILGNLHVKETANTISFEAKKSLSVKGGGGFIDISSGNITFGGANYETKAMLNEMAPTSLPVVIGNLPVVAPADLTMQYVDAYDNPLKGESVELVNTQTQEIKKQVTNASGLVEVKKTKGSFSADQTLRKDK